MSVDKVVADPADAIADVPAGASRAVGGFRLCGIPGVLIHALLERGAGGLRVVSNNCGVDDWGLGLLLRAGGSGIPAFYTPAGAGTWIEEGGLPWRYGADDSVAVASPSKETQVFDGRDHLLEEGITTGFALVRAAV